MGKFVFVAGKAPDGRRGRAGAAVLPSCFREAVGAASSARRGGPGARLPVPGRLEEAGRGGRERSGTRGARPPQRWDFSAREESGAGARPRRRSADSGAAGAVSRQLPAHLELPARKVPAVPALVPGLRAEICGFHLPRHGRERQNRAPHTLPRAQLPFQGSERIHQLPSPKVTGWPRALQSEWVCGALRCVSCN